MLISWNKNEVGVIGGFGRFYTEGIRVKQGDDERKRWEEHRLGPRVKTIPNTSHTVLLNDVVIWATSM